MNRDEQLRFCSICKNQVKDLKRGIICGITGSVPDFEDSCAFFNKDPLARENSGNDIEVGTVIGTNASIEKRLANHIIDIISIMIFSVIVGGLFGGALGFIDPEAISEFEAEAETTMRDYLFGFIVITLYYAIFESLTGRSVAKYITKTKVIDLNGEKPDLLTILVRTLCRFIPFDAISFLFYNGSGWHDRLSNTKVVDI